MQIDKTMNISNVGSICVDIWKRNLDINKKSREDY